jgi:PKD repeat protein
MRLILTFGLSVVTILFSSLILGQQPVSNFTALPVSVCQGQPVTFTNTSTTNGGSAITDYAWDFGDGYNDSIPNTTHIYNTPGTYSVTLTVTNSSGLADFELKTNYIIVKPAPITSFSVNGLGCTVPLTVTFNNTGSSGAGYSYNWNFGNSQTSPIANPPSQTYSSAGTYNVSLTITNNASGCVTTVVEPLVVSNFQAGMTLPSVVCVNQQVDISDNSTAGANVWNWNVLPSTGSYVNGTSNSSQNPSFTFTAAGTYTIQLSAQNTASGCSGSASQTITVQPTPAPTFTATPLTNCAPSNVTFTNTSVGGTSYVWTFGDFSSGANNTSNQTSPSHIYANNGTYDVTLTMTTATGCIGALTLNDYITVTDVLADFEADITGGCDPLVVNFSDLSVDPNSSNQITSWSWNFGGGTPNTFNGQNPPPITYPIGLFDVSLTVTTQSGCVGTVTLNDYITVGTINALSFSVDTLINCIKTDFEFTSTVSTTPANPNPSELTYFWDFTDGTSTEDDPTYQFTSDTGYFDVMLVVDFRGCKDTVQIDSFIYINAPIAKFSPENTLFCNQGNNIAVDFTDDATHGVPSDDILMIWQWGDGTPNTILDDPQLDDANQGDFTHTYTNYGSYTIQQVIYNYTTGCSDSITANVDISFLNANFTYSNDSICQGDTLDMFDNSQTWLTAPNPHPLQSWSFSMGDNPPGTVNMGDTAYYAYMQSGLFNITLTTTNSVGCSASSVLPINVLAPPFAVIAISPDPAIGCSPFPVTFTGNAFPMPPYTIPIDSMMFQYSDDNSTQTLNYNSAGTIANHTFVGTGIFYGEMIAIDQFGCYSAPASVPITITQPNSFFSVDNVICNGDSVITDNSSTGEGNLSYEWYLDDFTSAPISTSLNAATVLTETGIPFGQTTSTHDLFLITTDGNGCKDTIGNLISVSIPWAVPTYNFAGAAIGPNGEYVCPPLFGTFVDSSFSYGAITDWTWVFGNGNQSILENPSNTYVLPGTYDLTLSIIDENGCTADTTLLQYITIGGPGANPDWIQQVGQCAQGAQFVLINPVNVVNSVWTMGDNTTLTDSINFFYNYEQPGTYTPGVTLYDSLGCEVFYPLNPITVLDDGLTASFTATPNPAEQDQLISFIDGSTSQQSTIVLWNWDFGNNQVLALNNATQTNSFPLAGSYSVTLTILDALGCQDDYTLTVNIKDPEIWLPNVITANGDGTNDLFTLPFDAFKDFNIVIINRWGNTIHDGRRDPANPLFMWDGTTDNSGEKVTDGVYFYRLTGEMLGGTLVDKHGFVTVIESN